MTLSGYPLSYQKQPVLPVSCVSFQIVHISTNAKYSLQIVDYCLGYFFFLVHFGDHFLVISRIPLYRCHRLTWLLLTDKIVSKLLL